MASQPSAQQSGADHLPALTSLRFIAAFAVLVLHYRDLLRPMPDWVMRGVIGGQYGVTFFFILSGFILTYRYHGWFADGVSEGRFWRFQRYRFARIYPVYLVGLLLDTPWHLLERWQAGPEQLAAVGSTWWASWLLNLVGLQAWVPAIPFAMFWNTPAWSVAAEFFFYATFPFLCAALIRRRLRMPALAALFGLVIVAGVAIYAGVLWWLNQVLRVEGTTQYIVMVYNPLLRYSEFAAGCLAGLFFLRMQARPAGDPARARRWRDAVIVAALAAAALRIFLPDYVGPEMWRWVLDVAMKYGVFILPFGALILAVASGRNCLSWLLERPWMVLLGEASYALYIIHWSVTTVLRMGWHAHLGLPATPPVHAMFLLGTVGASVLCYRWIEVPWRERLRGPSSGARESAAATASASSPLSSSSATSPALP